MVLGTMRILVLLVFSSFVGQSLAATCTDFKTCGNCLGFPDDVCVWCSQPNVTVRCDSYANYKKQKKWCKGEFVSKPKSKHSNVTADLQLGSVQGLASPVQLRPQSISAKLGPGQEITFPMSFKHARHYPLDVYYLMDYSYTMNQHVKTLKAQSESVKRALTGFTNNVFFGLGSFVEKPRYPYVGVEHKAHAFLHHLNLTSDIKLFDTILNAKENYSNYDAPEAGLDALMQVMVCKDELGWRPNANRIIVLCTDATYHSAGDGKMVLAFKPNDMKCHLNNSYYYDYELKQDYPSISQISKTATDGKFKIIFATLSEVRKTYSNLARLIGAESALLNSGDGSITNIIKNAYLKSIRYITMKVQSDSKEGSSVQLKLSPDCTRPASAECIVGHDQEFKMKATLKVVSCPKDVSDYRQVLHVGPVGGGIQDRLEINLDILNCQCDCETDRSGVKNSKECSASGTLRCGICACNEGRSGDTCECDESKFDFETSQENCQNGNDTRICSGKGTCRCNKCTCYARYSGKFCQFDDTSCMRKNNRLCFGHGECTLGTCKCESDLWTGEDCGCSMLDHNCYAPYSKEICSGQGKCVCNECVCNKITGKQERYSGTFCEDCEKCDEKRCHELEDYARCNYLYNKTHCDGVHNTVNSANTDVQMLNKSEVNSPKWRNAKFCRMKLDEKRKIVFLHTYDKYDKKLLLIIQKELEEEPKADIWLPIGIAIGTVVLIGLLTVIAWKLIVDAMDEREYNKFQEQAKSEGFDVSLTNPLYQPASANFSNPMYDES